MSVASLASAPGHRYGYPGSFAVTLSITDHSGTTSRARSVELVRAAAGSYTDTNPQNGNPVTFYVAGTETSLQDVSIPLTYLDCTPGGAEIDAVVGIASVPLTSKGAFNSTTTQHGVYDGYPAVYTYVLRGSFDGLSSTGSPKVSGSFRETLTYTDSAARTCTTNNQSWTATRDTQPPQTTALPPVGSCAGTNPQNGNPVTFYVAAGQTSLEDVSIPLTYLDCTPGNAKFDNSVGISAVSLAAGGSFDSTTTQSGTFDGDPAMFTYVFDGHFHSLNDSGVERASGIFSETVTYNGGAATTCGTDDQSWTATFTN